MTFEERLRQQQDELQKVNQKVASLEIELANAKRQADFLWGTIGILQTLIEEGKKNEPEEKKEENKDGAGS